jgi:hypothetical protein
LLAIAGATLVPLPAMAGSKDASITNTQVNTASAAIDTSGRGRVTLVQLGSNAASNTIVQLGRRGDKAAAIDNTQVNTADASLAHRGKGALTVVQAGRNSVRNLVVQH